MSPALKGSSALQRFERSNAIEIRNRIMFDFYPGLPHVLFLCAMKLGMCTVVIVDVDNGYGSFFFFCKVFSEAQFIAL